MRIALLAFVLAGCQSLPVPETVKVPVPVPCVTEIPPRPDVFDEAALLAMNRYQFVLGLDADRRAWRLYAGLLEVQLRFCGERHGD
jgi:hypothetical protein